MIKTLTKETIMLAHNNVIKRMSEKDREDLDGLILLLISHVTCLREKLNEVVEAINKHNKSQHEYRETIE